MRDNFINTPRADELRRLLDISKARYCPLEFQSAGQEAIQMASILKNGERGFSADQAIIISELILNLYHEHLGD